MNRAYIGLALAGFLAGIVFGDRQMKRWQIETRLYRVILVLSCAVVFGLGGWLMSAYGYHILKAVRYWILMYGLILIGLIDSRKKIIPNKAVLVLLGVRTLLLAGEMACFPQLILEIAVSSGAGLAGGGLLFLTVSLIAKKGIGMGDIKLIGVMGYYLGFKVLMSNLIVTLTLTVLGGITGLVLRKTSLRSEMPFAPFAAAGTIITIMMGF
ncbi:hypothetical protein GPL15_07895 [Clostridium sp. MCC353]|uniref:prepilin peptidase n=1 Tax=Clostridium sp. MCC353 TaxID=2592646 RepID=UPI001C013AC2|nr:A24 family peptidase [Clostridium sp. MCC353]MBT9776424.1 hypothetical protein [Clostridium sp. MCC353]